MNANLDSTNEHPVDILISASPTQPQMRRPCTARFGNRVDYNTLCVPLYQASKSSDWKAADIIFGRCPEMVRSSITENYDTALHTAVSAKYTSSRELFVEELVRMMDEGDLACQNGNGETALCVAAAAGNVQLAKILVDRNETLLRIPDNQGKMPLCVAALSGKRDMVEYLYDTSHKMTGDFWTNENRDYVFMKCIEADLFDIALQIVKEHPELAISGNALRILARKPEAFKHYTAVESIKSVFTDAEAGSVVSLSFIWRSILELNKAAPPAGSALLLLRIIWRSILELNKDEIDVIVRGPPDPTKGAEKTTDCKNRAQEDEKSTTLEVEKPKYSSQMLFIAAEKGNTTFVVELIHGYPDLVKMVNDNKQSIFHVAASHRRKGICSLLYELGSIKDSVITRDDENGNNMLHVVGERAKGDQLQELPGIVVQVQQELKWFEEVDAMFLPSFREMKNKSGLTPRELFTKNHEDLVSEGERWLKEVAAQLMVVAALVATVAFAVPFTLPGGLNQETGTPIFLHKRLFTVFIISDTISFIFSSSLIILLISILTSRYTERDFSESLPWKLSLCLGTLFYALTALILTFFINLLILDQNKSIRIVAGVLVLFPAVLFSLFLNPLFSAMARTESSSRRRFFSD